jgi:pilus assembly protein Flp/PilA
MPSFAKRFLEDRSGATAIEYGLMAACIFCVIVTAVGALGSAVSGMFQQVADLFH